MAMEKSSTIDSFYSNPESPSPKTKKSQLVRSSAVMDIAGTHSESDKPAEVQESLAGADGEECTDQDPSSCLRAWSDHGPESPSRRKFSSPRTQIVHNAAARLKIEVRDKLEKETKDDEMKERLHQAEGCLNKALVDSRLDAKLNLLALAKGLADLRVTFEMIPITDVTTSLPTSALNTTMESPEQAISSPTAPDDPSTGFVAFNAQPTLPDERIRFGNMMQEYAQRLQMGRFKGFRDYIRGILLDSDEVYDMYYVLEAELEAEVAKLQRGSRS